MVELIKDASNSIFTKNPMRVFSNLVTNAHAHIWFVVNDIMFDDVYFTGTSGWYVIQQILFE